MPPRKLGGLPAAPTAVIDGSVRRFGTIEVVPLTVHRVPALRPLWPGPWRNEADRIAWTDPATGMACIILRSGHGHLCGYVAVEADHPLYGFNDDALPQEPPLRVHGGATYAWPCQQSAPIATSIRRTPPHPDAPPAWWFGFACHHSFDVVPGRSADAGGATSVSSRYGDRVDRDSCGNRGCSCPPIYHVVEGPFFTGAECGAVYRNEAYVYRQCAQLATQLYAVAKGLPMPDLPSSPPIGLVPHMVGTGR